MAKKKFQPPQLTDGAPSAFDPLLLQAAVSEAEKALDKIQRDAPKIIRRWRRGQANITLKEMGQRAGMSGEYISAIERGIRPPSFNAIKKILAVMTHGLKPQTPPKRNAGSSSR